ncbi:bifunctional metallophosphatase/5'-nucleotidase [Paenibacillus dendritiformis]|uniref:bifunctional metallophosphatase/5'-nucleotidase n=1 Tax=Paenibacillus dendritiformis TaxID=130049 RepID=UPI000DA90575|nr:bifunctional UDP-sugar hydrolase/5'-nucleotidase [Paenibacillus dendritiformis]PZM65599.1 bifunctional metallophosphatase/5'-nucleotidase [Paenibacillus dendritiformis]
MPSLQWNTSDSDSILLLYTNDIHSHWDGAARLASLMSRYRRHCGEKIVLLDGGDHMDRAYMETEGTYGAANVRLMNRLGYDAAVIGNNEGLTFVPERLGQVYRSNARFPVLAANVTAISTGQRPDWLKPWVELERGGIQIGIVGVTAPYVDYYRLLGWEVGDPITAVREAVSVLRPRVDLLVVLSHCGLTTDVKMAEETEGIDLILGGHSHHLLPDGHKVGRTWLLAAGKYGDHLGVAECRRVPSGELELSVRCIPVTGELPDPIVEAELLQARAEATRRLSVPVAQVAEPLAVQYNRPSPLGQLLAQALRDHTGADIGLVNAGQLLGDLPAGTVTEGMLHTLCPSPINPVRMHLSGADVKQAIRESLHEEAYGRVVRGYGFRGGQLGTLCVDGLQVEWRRGPDEERIRLWLDGWEVADNDRLVVGTIDMFVFGGGYPSLKNGQDITFFLPEVLRDILAVQLRKAEELSRCREDRLAIVHYR